MEFYRNKRILITGGLGFIGSNLAIQLHQIGSRVTIIDSLEDGCGGNNFNIPSEMNEIEIIREDLNSDRFFQRHFKSEFSYDLIFPLAGSCSHTDSMNAPVLDLKMNVLCILNLLEFLKETGIKTKIIYPGTRQIYGHPNQNPIDENHPIQPVDINGIHKYCAENYLQLYQRLYGIPSIRLRLPNVYGPRQLIKHSRLSVTGAFLGKAIRGEEILLYGGGTYLRDFCYIDDVISALLLAGMREDSLGDVFNISGTQATLFDFAHTIAKILPQCSITTAEYPPNFKEISIGSILLESKKFESITGWKPHTSLLLGIEKTINFLLENRGKY